MQKKDVMKELKVQSLKEYYKDKELTIIGLNDSRILNKYTLFRKELLKFLSDKLKSDELDSTIVDAFSIMFNKTEHIDYLLESNLSIGEIKDLQVYGMVSALEKVMADFYIPKFVGKIGYISKLIYRQKKGDDGNYLTDTLKYADDPIVIYSSGLNNLMDESWINPLTIGKDYRNRNKNINYECTLYQLQNPDTVKKVINGVEGNINNILSINNTADIFNFGLYIPKGMQCEGMEIFNDVIERYNEYLQELCLKYKTTYIDTKKISQDYNKSNINFRNALADEIIDYLFLIKNSNQEKDMKISDDNEFKIQNHKVLDVYVNLRHDLKKLQEECMGSFGRERQMYKEREEELKRQIEVIEKVAIKRL